MTAPQAFGKTQCAAIPALLYSIHYRKVSAFYVSASSHLAYTQWGKKIKKAMEEDAALSALIFENTDLGGNKEERRFTNSTSLHFAGAESVANLAGFTCPTIVCDDEHAYPDELLGFGNPADIAETRAGAFSSEQRTLVNIGTAGNVDDHLHRTLQASAFYVPLVPCLKCGAMQLLEFSRMVYDATSPHAAVADTWMRCARVSCDHKIRFEELPEMLRRHVWASSPPGEDWILKPAESGVCVESSRIVAYPDTKRLTMAAGFWCNAFYWPLGRTWGELAADYMARLGDPTKLKDWQQHIEVKPWKDPEVDENAITIEEVRSREKEAVRGYPAGTVPEEADFVTGAVDVQSGYCYYLFRAWRRADGESWLIDMKTVGRPATGETDKTRTILIPKSLDEIDQIARLGFDRISAKGEIVGKIYPSVIAVDRGYEPDIISQWWAQRHRNLWCMIRGARDSSRASLWPAKPLIDKRGRPYREIDVNQAKHILRECMRIPKGMAGYWNMPASGVKSDTLRAYARHMASEIFDREKKRWVKRHGHGANHYLDVETYNLCASRSVSVSLLMESHQKKAANLKEWYDKQRGGR